jgi:protein-S-isoprenylcysteine O-methyltransferase Ste14
MVRAGNFFFRYRDAVSPTVFLSLLLITRPVRPYGSAELDLALDAAGLLLAGTGQALRIAVIGYAYIVRAGGGRGRVYAEDLVTMGLFGVSRNPLYLGNLFIYGGLIVIWNSPWMYAVAGPFYLLLYRSIVAAEEVFLRAKFGEGYEAYCRDVPRWLPRLRRLRTSLQGMSFNWRRVILKDYGTVAAWTLTACLLFILERVAFESPASRGAAFWWIGAVMALIVVCWGAVRWLKLTRRLRA